MHSSFYSAFLCKAKHVTIILFVRLPVCCLIKLLMTLGDLEYLFKITEGQTENKETKEGHFAQSAYAQCAFSAACESERISTSGQH